MKRNLKRKFLALAVLCVGATMLSVRGASAPAVTWMVDGNVLEPSTTIEVRFDRDMVDTETVGTVAKQALAIEPALPGKFTWLSRRSGVYVPTQVPAMGKTYIFTLDPALKDARNEPVKSSFRATLKTPAFGLIDPLDQAGSGQEDDESPPLPEREFGFNRDVRVDHAAEFFRYVADDGKVVAADVQYVRRYWYDRQNEKSDDWDRRWELARGGGKSPGPRAATNGGGGDEETGVPLKTELVVKPVAPLTPGPAWRLEIKAGIESLTGGYRTTTARTIKLGHVAPFTIKSLVTANYLNAGRQLTIRFSDALAPDVDDDTAGKFFRITPAVDNLRFDQQRDELTIHGDFHRESEYRLEVDKSLLSENQLPLSGDLTRSIKFDPVKPRVYLPEITGHQLLAGQRKFPVHSVNLKSLHVTARLVPPAKAAQAVAAFDHYQNDGSDEDSKDPNVPVQQPDPDEPYRAIKPGAIDGRVIAERDFPLPDPKTDARQDTMLDWNELLDPAQAGMIFLTLEGNPLDGLGDKHRPCAQALTQLTDLGILWKKTGPQLAVNIFSMASGKPVGKTHIELLDQKFKRLAAAESADDGTASLTLGPDPGWLVASHGADLHVMRIGTRGEALPVRSFRMPIDYASWETPVREPPSMRVLMFTDRPLYQPGETVHVKGIVRRLGDGGLALGKSSKATLVLKTPRNDDRETKIHIDERGAFDADIVLDKSVTGHYTLVLKLPGNIDNSWSNDGYVFFQVGEYQPNTFNVNLAAPVRIAPAAPVTVDVAANYFFGAALGDCPVRWTLQYAPAYFSPNGFEEFDFYDYQESAPKSLTLRGEGKLSGGVMSIHPNLPEPVGHPYSGTLTAEVTDINQQTVSERVSFERDAADFYLGLARPEESVIARGEEIVARAVAVKPDGQPVREPVAVKAELIRVRHETVRVQGAGNAVSFRTESSEEVVATSSGQTLLPQRASDAWELPAGETARFKPDRAGQYLLRLSATDSKGRPTRVTYGFSVAGEEPIAWDYRNPAQVDLVPDKTEYQTGDTARIMVKTPISGEALVTVERGSRILRTLHPRLEGNAPLIEIPIDASDAPNTFVSMMLIRGADQSTRKIKAPDYRYGVCQLHVVNPSTRLKVEVTPRASAAEPGTEIITDLHVRDARGTAVPDAEVTFFAIDDGVLAITGYQRPQPTAVFERPLSLAVTTGLSLYQLMPDDPADCKYANKGYLIGGGGGDGPGLKLRRNFPGTACWMPALHTDAEGNLTVKFTAPDAITRYRLVAVVHAGANRFGSGESAVSLRKSFMIASALGQIANVGDEIIARAVVRNETGAAGTAKVSLILDSTAESKQADTVATVNLDNGAATTVEFPVRLRATGNAEWKWSAHLDANGKSFDDGLVANLKVGSPAPVLRETYLTELSAPSNDLLAGVNPQLIEGSGLLNVTLSNTRLASLRETATYLLDYPYGCAEQTVSALVPWVVARDLGPVLPEAVKNKAARSDAIAAGIAKLAALQTADGGIAYWPGAREASLFPSAYAALVLALLEQQGVTVSVKMPELHKYVSTQLRGIGGKRREATLDDCALAVFALAVGGKSEPAYHEKLYNLRAEMSHEGRALLACAMLGAKASGKNVATLLDPRAAAPDAFSWFGSGTRERAALLLAWCAYKPADQEVRRLAKELLAARVNGRWRTTQENAWALLALKMYFTTVEKEVKPVEAELVKDGNTNPVSLTKERLAQSYPFTFGTAASLGTLEVKNPQQQALYGESVFVVTPPVAAQPRQDRGYAVSRFYQKIAADGSLRDADSLEVGDRVVVTLRIETQRPGHFVAIDDPLPAILEAVNPEFRTRQTGEETAADEFDWVSSYREIRADRVLYFCDHLPAGTFTFHYLARVRTAGNVTAPAVKVEEMYRPERFGLSASERLSSVQAGIK